MPCSNKSVCHQLLSPRDAPTEARVLEGPCSETRETTLVRSPGTQPERSPTVHSQRGAPLSTGREEPHCLQAERSPTVQRQRAAPTVHRQRGVPLSTDREEPHCPHPERTPTVYRQRGAPLSTAREEPSGNHDPAQPDTNREMAKIPLQKASGGKTPPAPKKDYHQAGI